MKQFTVAVLVVVGLVAIMFAQEPVQDPQPVPQQPAPLASKASDPYEALAHQLELELSQLRAEVLARDIAISNCSATVDSVRLTKRADAMVAEFTRLYGGEWVWRSCQAGETANCNKPVRVQVATEKEKKP